MMAVWFIATFIGGFFAGWQTLSKMVSFAFKNDRVRRKLAANPKVIKNLDDLLKYRT